MNIQTIDWKNNQIKLIDQTKLPQRLEYVYLRDIKTLWQAIKTMKIRGAPALGAAAGLGVYLGIRDSLAKNFIQFKNELDEVINYIGSSRPTAKNLFWALDRMRNIAINNKEKSVSIIKKILFIEAQKIIREDKITCRKIGYYGKKLIKNRDTVLTICNAGMLATIDYGTALGIIYAAHQEAKKIAVFACETRPMLQGARLTTWELNKRGIDVTLVCDSMAATLMKKGKINKVIAGADCIARNGDTANKVGTYNLAVLSYYHRIPFYIAAPQSTFDLRIKTGEDIPIEERDSQEVTRLFFRKPITVKGIKVFNPAFDVTPHNLITAIISDRGIIKPPYERNIKRMMSNAK